MILYRVPCGSGMEWVFALGERQLECRECGLVYRAPVGQGEIFWKWVAACHAARHSEWTPDDRAFISCRYRQGLLFRGLTHWTWTTQDGHNPFNPYGEF